jgi:serine/threonine protein kinase
MFPISILVGNKLPLDWATCVNIAAGTARGLSYLHNDLAAPLIHRDVKSANILLDAKMQAQVRRFHHFNSLETYCYVVLVQPTPVAFKGTLAALGVTTHDFFQCVLCVRRVLLSFAASWKGLLMSTLSG